MIRIGVIGLGVIGRQRAEAFDRRDDCTVTAVCDRLPANRAWARETLGEGLVCTDQLAACWPHIDLLIIATPHWSHPELAMAAFAAGKDVLLEKPAGVHVQQVRAMNLAAIDSGRLFAIHFQHRFRRDMVLIRDLVQGGELGRIRRIAWSLTHWFRHQAYYDSGSWRGSWQGEGGGVLLNQAPHQLDLWQWIFGMPERIRAHCHCGKHHAIEVEDEVTAYLEYADGCTGTFITSTAECPGTDRLEIVGDHGRLVYEEGRFDYRRLRRPLTEALAGDEDRPQHWAVDLPARPDPDEGVAALADHLCAAIRGETELLVPGISGINQVLLSNAMLQSSWDDDWVDCVHFDAERYQQQLGARCAQPVGG